MVVPIIEKYIIIITMIVSFSACSLKVCECNSPESAKKIVDRDSNNFELKFTPQGE
jgi:hypothetical protein